MQGVLLGLVVGGLCVLLMGRLRSWLPGLGQRAWILSGLLLVAVLGVAGTSMLRGSAVLPARCTILSSELVDVTVADLPFVEARVLVSWRARGRTFTLRRPAVLTRQPASERDRLSRMLVPGAPMMCSYLAARPGRVFFHRASPRRSSRRDGALACLAAASLLAGWLLVRGRALALTAPAAARARPPRRAPRHR